VSSSTTDPSRPELTQLTRPDLADPADPADRNSGYSLLRAPPALLLRLI